MNVDESTRRKVPKWSIGVAVLAFGLVCGVGACTALLHELDFDLKIGRQPLAPIPVPVTACPYLRPIHTVVAELEKQWKGALDGSDPWPRFRVELAAELPALQDALTRAKPHVPAPIADKFETMILDLRVGRAELPRAPSALDYLNFPDAGKSVVVDGNNALSDASDLVGQACGFPLASEFTSY